MWQQHGFEAEPLRDLAGAMGKRARALNHTFAGVRLERDFDDRLAPAMERLCATFSLGHATTARSA